MPGEHPSRHGPAYAGLDFIRAAFCPLHFTATKLSDHPEFSHLKPDAPLAQIEVGRPLSYARQFRFTNQQGHRKTGTQIVTAPFGLAPVDFDLFLGLYTYLKRLPEIPADGTVHLTVDFLAKELSLPATCQKDYLRIRSRIFRFSYAKYTNSAFWNPSTKTYDIVNFGFYNLDALSRVTESRRPITLRFDPSFLKILAASRHLSLDYELYRSLSPALRRLYLIANRDGWNQRSSSVFLADDFAIHQIGYDESEGLSKLRLQKLRRLFTDAEDADLVRPYQPWGGYFERLATGPDRGRPAVRWTRGPRLKAKPCETPKRSVDDLESDALFAQVLQLRDETSKPISPAVYRHLLATHGRDRLQKHIAIILAQKESYPGAFQKSEVAAFVNRVQHDYPEPDWYRDLRRAERLSPFEKVQPNQLSMDLYENFFVDSR